MVFYAVGALSAPAQLVIFEALGGGVVSRVALVAVWAYLLKSVSFGQSLRVFGGSLVAFLTLSLTGVAK